MFVHWGLYSAHAGTWEGKPAPCEKNPEHIQRVVNVDTHTYAAAAFPKFRPREGFALHDSKFTQYDVGDVLNRDPY